MSIHTYSLPLTLQVYVVPPSSIGFLPSTVEVMMGRVLLLPLQVKGLTLEDTPTEVPFYDCRYMQFKLKIADDAIFNATVGADIGQ